MYLKYIELSTFIALIRLCASGYFVAHDAIKSNKIFKWITFVLNSFFELSLVFNDKIKFETKKCYANIYKFGPIFMGAINITFIMNKCISR